MPSSGSGSSSSGGGESSSNTLLLGCGAAAAGALASYMYCRSQIKTKADECYRMKKAKLFPLVGVAMILVRESDEHVLLGRRKASHGSGKLAFPGGHLESNESWAECAKRECAEETGVEIEGEPRFLGATNDIMEAEGRHYITIFMAARVKHSQQVVNMEPDKCESWDWWSWEAVRGLRADEVFVPITNFVAAGLSPV